LRFSHLTALTALGSIVAQSRRPHYTAASAGHAGASQRRQQPGWPGLPQQARREIILRRMLAAAMDNT